MLKSKPLVLVTRKLPEQVEARMMELFKTKINEKDIPLTNQELILSTKNSDVIVPTVTDSISAEVIQKFNKKLKLIANFGAGIDHIDLDAANKKGIVVTNTPDVMTEDTADMAMALILAVPRRIVEGERLIRSGKWKGWSPMHMTGQRIWGKRLGIIGMGRIGQAVARRAKGFGISVHYPNRNKLPDSVEKEFNATFWDSLDQMLSRVDIISVNCPKTPSTYHLLSPERLKLIKKHAYIVNTSRGEVIDESFLAKLLREKKLAGAGLDVFERAPNIEPSLLSAPNTVLLPHLGSATTEARIEMGEKVIVNIRSFFDNHKPPNRVIAQMSE